MKKINIFICFIFIILSILGCSPVVTTKGNRLVYKGKEYIPLVFDIHPHYSLTWVEIDTIKMYCSDDVYGYYVFQEDEEERYLYSDATGFYVLEDTILPQYDNSEVQEIRFYDARVDSICQIYNDISFTIGEIIDYSIDETEMKWIDLPRTYMSVVYKDNLYVMFSFMVFKNEGTYYLKFDDERFKLKEEYNYFFESIPFYENPYQF